MPDIVRGHARLQAVALTLPRGRPAAVAAALFAIVVRGARGFLVSSRPSAARHG